MTSRGRKQCHPVRAYFSYMEESNTSECIVKIDNKICGHTSKGNHATNLEWHIAMKHPLEFCELTRLKVCDKRRRCNSDTVDYGAKRNKKQDVCTVRLNDSEVMDACVELVTVNARPFTLMEDSGFRKLLNPILEGLQDKIVINAENIRSEITARAQCIRRDIQTEMLGRLVCLKVDTATRLGRSFLGLNLQYVKDGKLVLRTLCAKEIFGSHSAYNLKEDIKRIISTYGLNLRSVYSVTTDNASNMVKCVKLMAEEIEADHPSEFEEDRDDEDATLENLLISEDASLEIKGVRCAAHTLQLAVCAVIKKDPYVDIIRKVRELCKFLRLPSMLLPLKALGLQKPPIDYPTRWSSTYEMCKSVFNKKDLCREIASDYVNEEFSEATWKQVEELINALEPAKIATKRLQEEQLVMGDFFPSVAFM